MDGMHWPKGWFTSQEVRPGGSGFHHGTQNSAQFKTYALFTSGFFHLIILDCGCPRVTETLERETTDQRRLWYFYFEIYNIWSGSRKLWTVNFPNLPPPFHPYQAFNGEKWTGKSPWMLLFNNTENRFITILKSTWILDEKSSIPHPQLWAWELC